MPLGRLLAVFPETSLFCKQSASPTEQIICLFPEPLTKSGVSKVGSSAVLVVPLQSGAVKFAQKVCWYEQYSVPTVLIVNVQVLTTIFDSGAYNVSVKIPGTPNAPAVYVMDDEPCPLVIDHPAPLTLHE